MAANGQFFLIPLWIFEDRTWTVLSLPAKAVLMAIFRHINRQGVAWPSQSTLGREAGIKSRLAVRRATSELVAYDLIAISKKRNPRGGPFNVYYRKLTADFTAHGTDRFLPFYYSVIDSGVWSRCTPVGRALYPVLRWKAKIYGDGDTDYGGGWVHENDLEEHLQNRRWDICRRVNYESLTRLAQWAGVDRRSVGGALQSLHEVGLIGDMPEVKGAYRVMLGACNEHSLNYANAHVM